MEEKLKDNKNIIIIIILLLCVLLLVAGYIAITRQLAVLPTSTTIGEWNIQITNISNGKATGGAKDITNPTHTNLSATINAQFSYLNDAMTYKMTIANKGTLDATLNTILLTPNSTNSSFKIEFIGLKAGDQLKAGETIDVDFKITCTNNTHLGEEISFYAVLDYIQSSSSRKNTTTNISNKVATYNIGDEVKLSNNTSWYVIHDDGTDGYITLLSKRLVKVTETEQYKVDERGDLYITSDCENVCQAKYEQSQVSTYLKETYKTKLKNSGIEFGKDGELRLITLSELGTISALSKEHTVLYLPKAPSWLINDSYGTWYTMSDSENGLYLVNGDESITDAATRAAHLRPVIKILKTNIR